MHRVHYHKTLPKKTYLQVRWTLRSYPQLAMQRSAALGLSPAVSAVPRSSGRTSDPTSWTVIKLEDVTKQLDAVDHAASRLDEPFRTAIFNNCVYGKPFPEVAALNTWKEYKRDFYYLVAVGLGLPLEE